MKRSWYDYYKSNKKIQISNLLLHWPYLLKIIFLRPKRLLEIGSGPADHSVFLSYLLPTSKLSLLDSDKKIVECLKKRLRNKIDNIFFCDLTKKKQVDKYLKRKKFDIIYSQGLMEHFKAKDFERIINTILPYADRLIFSIPSKDYPNKDFGNEILRDRAQLELLLSSIPNIKYEITSYFPDIGLRTKILKIKKQRMNFFHALLFLLFGSCHFLIQVAKKI